MALWNLAGKASNVPAYQRLGGKFRGKVYCYADTDGSPGPKIFVGRLKERMDRGYTYLKMNLGVQLV
ncbi:MAG: hypothetical protein EXQ58_11510 [Acidobacteria bacterium]|nr:hypothetical protein [Acidobacteriota bacterium]